MKRTAMLIVAGITLIALSVGIQAASSEVAGGSPPVALVYDDAAQQVALTIPTPPCAPGQEGCKWVLFVNEPKVPGKPVVGSVTGTTGVLTVKYPPRFCGVLQADARTGPPFTQVYGLLHTVEGSNCTPLTSTSTSTTTTTLGPPTATAQPPVPPNASATAVPPVIGPAAASTGSVAEPPAASGTSLPASAAPTGLPFTGIDVTPLLLVGLALVATGLGLLMRRTRTTA
jgi:hypothetical protein